MRDIDGDALAQAPLSDIKAALDQAPYGSTLHQAILSVLRVVAVELIAGAVPPGMTAGEATSRGRDLLALLNSHRI